MGYITDERFRGSIGDLWAFQRPGLETIRRYIRGELPGSLISKLVRMSVEESIGSATPLKLLVCTLILLGSSGCATAWARGIVRDETGKEVSGAQIAVSAIGSDAVGVRGESESNGCFNVTARAGKDQPEFVLTVTAPGYKPVHVQFQQKERLTALVTLAPKDGPGEGAVTRVEVSDQQKVFEEPCIPYVISAASQLGIR